MSFDPQYRLIREIGIGSINFGAPPGANVWAPGVGGAVPPIGAAVIGSGTIRPSMVGGVVSWAFIDDAQHSPIFFTSVEQSPDTPTRIRINYPLVTKISSFMVVVDETFAGQLTGVGSTVTNSWADIQIGATQRMYRMAFQGTVGGNLQLIPSVTNWLPDANVVGNAVAILNAPPSLEAPFNNFNVYGAYYMGPNGYFVAKITSGLGPFNTGFKIVNNVGADIVPGVNDFMILEVGNPVTEEINAFDPNNPWWSQAFANFWMFGIFIL